MTIKHIARVGIDTPLRRLFDYRLAESCLSVEAGCRVYVPFGRRRVIGIVVDKIDYSEIEQKRLKTIQKVIDTRPLFDSESLALIQWAADYYQYSLGAALFSALPPALRKLNKTVQPRGGWWRASAQAPERIPAAPRQEKILDFIRQHTEGIQQRLINQRFPACYTSLKALKTRGYIERLPARPHAFAAGVKSRPLTLTKDQQHAAEKILAGLAEFHVHLLEGVTGSGKTQVYFSVIAKVLANSNQQVLIIVPEIGLTPQLEARLTDQFGASVGLLHSSVSNAARKQTWLDIAAGRVRIILGTRLSVFTPVPRLGLIVIDEEHDPSLKQQEGFLYHARDVAVYRARQRAIPVILGSATPSFESLHNADTKKYQHLLLSKRVYSDLMPRIHIIDMRAQPGGAILSSPLSKAMHEHLQAGRQIILFLNRRGYAPALLCHDCGWVARCLRCDSNMTYHATSNKLRCHHCGSHQHKPRQCPHCRSENLLLIGHGTQRIEELLAKKFPAYKSARLDRDRTRRKHALQALLADIHAQKFQIIVGTQMLSKGHDFPNVSLVGILDIDYGIHSSDFRALERSAQLLIQVAGRSGRRSRRGEVFVQTHTPDHPLLSTLLNHGYPNFAQQALAARKTWQLPPYAYHICIRAGSTKTENLYAFLEHSAVILRQAMPAGVSVQGPISPAMEKRAGQYRAFILLSAARRGLFAKQLRHCLDQIEALSQARKVRWAVDVDPCDYF